MEQENIKVSENSKGEEGSNYFLKITLTEALLVILILLIILACKFFLAKEFGKISEWYADNIAVDTDPDEVIGTLADGGIDEI